MKHRVLCLVALFIFLSGSFTLALAIDNSVPVKNATHVPGEILIGFKTHVTVSQIKAIVTSIGGEIKGQINLPTAKIRKVRIPSADQSIIDTAIINLRTNPSFTHAIKYAEPNIIKRLHSTTVKSDMKGILSQSGDSLIDLQWGYYDIGANWLPAPSTTTAPLVAVIDTGVDYTHPDLTGKIIKGRDYVNDDTDPMDDHGHGTHVAGIIAAKVNNNYGIAGISSVLSLTVLYI